MLQLPAGFDTSLFVSDLVTAAVPFVVIAGILTVYYLVKKSLNRL